jgi:hypothetical protein
MEELLEHGLLLPKDRLHNRQFVLDIHNFNQQFRFLVQTEEIFEFFPLLLLVEFLILELIGQPPKLVVETTLVFRNSVNGRLETLVKTKSHRAPSLEEVETRSQNEVKEVFGGSYDGPVLVFQQLPDNIGAQVEVFAPGVWKACDDSPC